MTKMSAFNNVIQHNFKSPSHGNQREKEIQGIKIGKEEVKLSLFVDDMILHLEYPEDTTRKLSELINTQKLVAFKYTKTKDQK